MPIGFIKDNIKHSPQELREMTYLSYERSQLQYAHVVWDPHKLKDILNFKMFTKKLQDISSQTYYSKYGSVTRMIREFGLQNLQDRRKDKRSTMFYKILNEIANIPKEELYELEESIDFTFAYPPKIQINTNIPSSYELLYHSGKSAK